MLYPLNVALPEKSVVYWRKACEFGPKGFSAASLAGVACGAPYLAAKQWIRKMRKLGELVVVGTAPASAGPDRFLYAIKRPRPKPPSLHLAADGYGIVREQVWQTMRMLKGSWTVEELALASSTEEVKVLRDTAQRYVRALTRAGIVAVIEPATYSRRGSTCVRYALTRAGNTGPLAPMLYRADLVHDRNLQKIVGESKVEVSHGVA